jgi:uncharacterized OsmC-like protein
MNREELRAVQAPLKQRYRDEPAAALITLKAEGRLSDGVSCSVSTGRALVEAGLHPATGGTGMLACSGVTLSAVATSLGIGLRGGRLIAEGDLDVRGTLGVAKDPPVGFREIRLAIVLDTDAGPDERRKLLELTERYCVVYQTLRGGPKLIVTDRER